MISGIGPAVDLEPYGMEVREDLPVGHNLQDHCMCQLNYETDEPSLFGTFTPENFELFAKEGRGPLTSNIPEAAAFFHTRPGLEAPDMQFHYAPSMFYDEGLTAPHTGGYCFGPVVIKPTSRGRVLLRAPLADSKPRVLCNFLTTEEDRRCMLEGMRKALEVAAQEPLQKVLRKPFSVPAGDSDTEIMEFVERASQIGLPPDVDLRDRRGRRSAAAGLRLRGPARGGCVGHADDHPRQHERRDDHDRGDGRGPDPLAMTTVRDATGRARGSVAARSRRVTDATLPLRTVPIRGER